MGWNLGVAMILMLSFTSLLFIPTQIYAQNDSFSWDLPYKFMIFVEDLHEAITVNPIRLAELKAEHIQNVETKISNFVAKGEPVPQDLLDRKTEKMIQTNEIISDIPFLQNVHEGVKTITDLADLGQIRIAVDEFNKLKSISDKFPEEKRQLARQIDDRLNNLESVKRHCLQPIDSLNLSYLKDPYPTLQNQCPKLKDIPRIEAERILFG